MIDEGRTIELAADMERMARCREAVIEAMGKLEDTLTEFPAWSELDKLSSHTEVDTVEAAPDGVFIKADGNFEAIGTVYVVLKYGGQKDGFTSNDSFPIEVRGRVDDRLTVEIESVSIDNSSFYGIESSLSR